MVAQARAVAESGLERAIWALNNPTDTNGIPLAGPVPALYDNLTTGSGIPITVNGTQIGFAAEGHHRLRRVRPERAESGGSGLGPE